MSLSFDGKSQCLSVSGLPVGALTLTLNLAEPLNSRQGGCLYDSRYPFGSGYSWATRAPLGTWEAVNARISEDTLTLTLQVQSQTGALMLFADWKRQNALSVVINSITICDALGTVLREYQLSGLSSNQVPDQAGNGDAELHGFSFNAIPNWTDWGYWYVCKAVQDADGGWSAPAIGGAGWCGWYADIGGVKYVAVRLPQPRTDVPTTDAVTLAQVLSGYSGTPYGRVEGS